VDIKSARVMKTIELVRKFELDDYEVIHPVLHHYRFILECGVVDRIGIIEVLSCRDWLIENGLYKKAVQAEIIQLDDFR